MIEKRQRLLKTLEALQETVDRDTTLEPIRETAKNKILILQERLKELIKENVSLENIKNVQYFKDLGLTSILFKNNTISKDNYHYKIKSVKLNTEEDLKNYEDSLTLENFILFKTINAMFNISNYDAKCVFIGDVYKDDKLIQKDTTLSLWGYYNTQLCNDVSFSWKEGYNIKERMDPNIEWDIRQIALKIWNDYFTEMIKICGSNCQFLLED